MQRPQALICLE
uniref:Uncharacterized protein n=1 Tax=Arundo donax TaxID=35708 RepID=A0A0A9BEP5_ARUDO